jgi:hypothetical protein
MRTRQSSIASKTSSGNRFDCLLTAPGNDVPTNDEVMKHLEFIQGVISRQATNSFLLKGWALTVAGAVYAFATKGTDWRVAAIGLMPVVIFWGLDGYYLRQERLFRCLYDAVRRTPSTVEVYAMSTAP